MSGVGVPTVLLSIPTRNIHSVVETFDRSDVESLADLLVAAIPVLALA
jgi:putative aminopeptidase FrvX